MDREQKLSKKSQLFLENLNVYLFSSGKDEGQINSIVDELEDHLMEAEAKGKTVDHIVGQSPKVYMKSLSQEMTTDFKTIYKYLFMIILGVLSYTVLIDAIQGPISYSLFELIGVILISLIMVLAISVVLKYIAANNVSKMKEFGLYYFMSWLSVALFVALIYVNDLMNTPILHFGEMGTVITVIITLLFLIGFSLWSKTWLLVIVLALLVIPDFLFKFIEIHTNIQFLLTSIIPFGGIAIYLFFYARSQMK